MLAPAAAAASTTPVAPAGATAQDQKLIAAAQMRTVGLIGGTSWHSTVDYYRHINQAVNDAYGDNTNPPLARSGSSGRPTRWRTGSCSGI